MSMSFAVAMTKHLRNSSKRRKSCGSLFGRSQSLVTWSHHFGPETRQSEACGRKKSWSPHGDQEARKETEEEKWLGTR